VSKLEAATPVERGPYGRGCINTIIGGWSCDFRLRCFCPTSECHEGDIPFIKFQEQSTIYENTYIGRSVLSTLFLIYHLFINNITYTVYSLQCALPHPYHLLQDYIAVASAGASVTSHIHNNHHLSRRTRRYTTTTNSDHHENSNSSAEFHSPLGHPST
jgi:hypothetical protein